MKTTIQVFPAAQSSTLTFGLLAGKVLKITTLSKLAELVIEENDERLAAEVAATIKRFLPALQPKTSVSITEATEEDLLTATADSPSVAADLEKLLRHIRTVPADAPPVRVEIVNPEDLKPHRPETNRRIHVERDSSGTLTGAVVTDA
jgi:hypothetical protein